MLSNAAGSFTAYCEKYPELATFVGDELYPAVVKRGAQYTIVHAPVKSGKRLMVQAFAARCNRRGAAAPRNIFITALNRRTDKGQRDILQEILGEDSVHIVSARRTAEATIDYVRGLPDGACIHVDELDYGSGADQLLSAVWEEFSAAPGLHWIFYSASPEELLQSPLDTTYLRFTPPESIFRGPGWFLDSGLAFEATPFFNLPAIPRKPRRRARDTDESYKAAMQNYEVAMQTAARLEISLSEQGTEIVEGLWRQVHAGDQRRAAVVRITVPGLLVHIYERMCGGGDAGTKITGFVGVKLYFVHSQINHRRDNVPQWDKIGWWQSEENIPVDAPTIIFIDMACTRSTDWYCHPFLYAYHDYRNAEHSAYNVIQQAQERVNHYITKDGYEGREQRILLYGNITALLLSAGRISYEDYPWRMSLRSRCHKERSGSGGVRPGPEGIEWDIPVKFEIMPRDCPYLFQMQKLKGAKKTAVAEYFNELMGGELTGYTLHFIRRHKNGISGIIAEIERAIERGYGYGTYHGAPPREGDSYRLFWLDLVEGTATGGDGQAMVFITRILRSLEGDAATDVTQYIHETGTKSMYT